MSKAGAGNPHVWELLRKERTLQVGKFPPNDVTGILNDRDLLVMTTTLRENGRPSWVVVSLKVEGDTMMLAQMMERSETIKRGSGKKQAD